MGKPTPEEHNEVKKLQQGVSDARNALDILSGEKKAAADDVTYVQIKLLVDLVELLANNNVDPGELAELKASYNAAVLNWQDAGKRYNQLVKDYELASSYFTYKLDQCSNTLISVTTKDIVSGAENSIKTHASVVAAAPDTKP